MGNASKRSTIHTAALVVVLTAPGCQRTAPQPVSAQVVDAAVPHKQSLDAAVASQPDLASPLTEQEAAQLKTDPETPWDRRYAAFSRLLVLHPDSASLFAELAHAAYGQNDLRVAEDAAQKALSKTQDPATKSAALYHLGLVQEERGELGLATDYYQQALRAKPSEELRSRLSILSQITPADAKFRVFLSGYAQKKGMYVQDSWSANLDEDPERERVAILCRHGDLDATYIVEDKPEQRWSFIAKEDGSRHPHCGAGERGRTWHIEKQSVVDLSHFEHQERDLLTLALRNGQPAVIQQGYDVWDFEDRESERHDVKLTIDWDKLVGESQDTQGIYAWPLATALRTKIPKELHPLLPIVKEETQGIPPLVAAVLQGRPAWRGPEDASLSLSATLTSAKTLRIVLALRDDVSVPATLEAQASGDYLELQRKEDDLLIAVLSDGNLLIRPGKRGWKGVLPTGSVSSGKIELLFPEPEADTDQGEPLSPYPRSFQPWQVKFHDRDKIGGPEETVLGFTTTPVLIALPGYARYPNPSSLVALHD